MKTALVLSGGTGSRIGKEIPKQYLAVGGKSVIAYCLETIFAHQEIDAVQIVAAPLWQDFLMEEIQKRGKPWLEKWRGFSPPGETRQLSIWNGLQSMRSYAEETDWVLIHDAARPMLTQEEITDCLQGAEGHEGAMPVLSMKDTVYYSMEGKRVEALLERSRIFAGQAPEVFLFGKYYEANQSLLPEKILHINGSTEPAILAGMDIAMLSGKEQNFKITTLQDLERFRHIIEEQKRV